MSTDGVRTFILCIYQDIEWGSEDTTIGFNLGDGITSFTLPESTTTDGVLMLENSTNVGIPGTFIFRADEPLPGSYKSGGVLLQTGVLDPTHIIKLCH